MFICSYLHTHTHTYTETQTETKQRPGIRPVVPEALEAAPGQRASSNPRELSDSGFRLDGSGSRRDAGFGR